MLTHQEVLLRLGVSLLFGLIIGFERSFWGKPIGLRTYSLVCLGSTLFMIISAYGIQVVPAGNLLHAADPGRIAAQVVVGIGFLGTGVILRDRGRIRGITTAAELWVSAAFGMIIGLGLFFLAAISLACVFIGLYTHNLFIWIGLIPRPDRNQDRQDYVDQD